MASEHRPRILLDANVIFSGFRGSGPPSQLIDMAGERFTMLVTDEVISEVLRNISRKAPFVLVEVEEWFESIDVQGGIPGTDVIGLCFYRCRDDMRVFAELDLVFANRARQHLPDLPRRPQSSQPGPESLIAS